jgi:hypothetical protein
MNAANSPEPGSDHRRHLVGVGLVGLVLVLLAAGLGGAGWAAGAAVGASVGLMNLWAMGLVVRGLLTGSRRKAAYIVLLVLKFGVLVGGCYLLVRAGLVGLLPLALGYGALPLGVVSAELASRRPVGEEK